MKFREAINSYMTYKEITTSDGNFRYLQAKTKVIDELLGNYDVYSLNRRVLLVFIKDLKERNSSISNATLNKYVLIINQILKYECNIKIEFEKLKENVKTYETIPEEVIDKIFIYLNSKITNVNSHKMYLIFRILLDTGLRINELFNVKVSDIDLTMNVIHVRITKAKRERYVFFSDETKHILELYIFKYLVKGYLFQNTSGKQQDYKSFMKSVDRLRKRLNIKISISPHRWRHTFASNYIKNGGDTVSLQKLLGHANLSQTQRYVHLSKEELRLRYYETMGVNNGA